MIMNSSYNETLSGETLSSMSEKSDSYFTTELDSRWRRWGWWWWRLTTVCRHRPGGGSRYLAEHSPVYGPADFQVTIIVASLITWALCTAHLARKNLGKSWKVLPFDKIHQQQLHSCLILPQLQCSGCKIKRLANRSPWSHSTKTKHQAPKPKNKNPAPRPNTATPNQASHSKNGSGALPPSPPAFWSLYIVTFNENFKWIVCLFLAWVACSARVVLTVIFHVVVIKSKYYGTDVRPSEKIQDVH